MCYKVPSSTQGSSPILRGKSEPSRWGMMGIQPKAIAWLDLWTFRDFQIVMVKVLSPKTPDWAPLMAVRDLNHLRWAMAVIKPSLYLVTRRVGPRASRKANGHKGGGNLRHRHKHSTHF